MAPSTQAGRQPGIGVKAGLAALAEGATEGIEGAGVSVTTAELGCEEGGAPPPLQATMQL